MLKDYYFEMKDYGMVYNSKITWLDVYNEDNRLILHTDHKPVYIDFSMPSIYFNRMPIRFMLARSCSV